MSKPIEITPGCECRALLHPGETCEAALACLEAMLDGCTCGGYWDVDRRAVEHDGFCDLVPSPEGCEDCGLTWVHMDDCPREGAAISWPTCSCGLGCTLGHGCLRVQAHRDGHVFAGPCEAVS